MGTYKLDKFMIDSYENRTKSICFYRHRQVIVSFGHPQDIAQMPGGMDCNEQLENYLSAVLQMGSSLISVSHFKFI